MKHGDYKRGAGAGVDRVCTWRVMMGDHTRMTSTTLTAAREGVNISRALAWMGIGSRRRDCGSGRTADMTEACFGSIDRRRLHRRQGGRGKT